MTMMSAGGTEMGKKTTIAFTFSVMVVLLWCSTALPHYSSGVEPVGERTASFLASPFIAAFDPAPLTYSPPLYLDAPQVPPGKCRWERSVLDSNGRPVLDQYGKPLKEYMIGPCRQNPPY
jgi:hypothetical protein